MNAAIEHYSKLWTVTDVHGHESYDLRCVRRSKEMRVEVKGTSTNGESVLLTPNEVAHAHAFSAMTLFILADIQVLRDPGGGVTAKGGRAVVIEPWDITKGALTPIGYGYRLP